MPYSDIQNRVTINGDASFKSSITAAMTSMYNGSALAAAAINSWLNAHPGNITINFNANDASSVAGQGTIFIDPNFFANNYYLSTSGAAVKDTLLSGLTHEMGHAVTGKIDNDSFSNMAGDNVVTVNTWYAQLGIAKQASYNAYDRYAVQPKYLAANYQYTRGKAVVNTVMDRGGVYDNTSLGGFSFNTSNVNLTASGTLGATLIVGGVGNDTYVGTTSNDWIYTGGGTDQINGGAGNDVIVAQSGTVNISFGSGAGKDVAETVVGAGTYKLTLTGLNPSDISVIAGGEDLYGGFAWNAGLVAFEFVTLKVTSSGDEITFVNQNRGVGTYANPTSAQAGVTYAAAHSALSSITFANGTVWNASDLWNHIANKTTNTDVTWDLMFRGTGSGPGGTRQIEHNNSTYNGYVNGLYFVPDPITSSTPPPPASARATHPIPSTSWGVASFDDHAYLLGATRGTPDLTTFSRNIGRDSIGAFDRGLVASVSPGHTWHIS